jgi:hypothetical protein
MLFLEFSFCFSVFARVENLSWSKKALTRLCSAVNAYPNAYCVKVMLVVLKAHFDQLLPSVCPGLQEWIHLLVRW